MSEQSETEKPMSREDTLRALQFLDRAQCSEGLVKDATDKGICALAKSKKFTEMAKLSRFAEDLGKKFLSTLGEEIFNTQDPFKLLKILEKERPDWKEIMGRFNKAKDYEVKAAVGDTPAMIIFKYADGKTEEYPLELSFRHRAAVAEGLASALRRMLAAKGDKDSAEKKDEEKDTENQIDQAKRLNDKIETLRPLAMPQAAYAELLNSAPNLPPKMLKELSVPLSKRASLFSRINVNPSSGEIDYSGISSHDLFVTTRDAREIVGTYYPDFLGGKANLSQNVQNDIESIADRFLLE